MFILCALLPVGAVAIISYVQVTSQLSGQSRSRVRQASKAAGLAIFDRLQFLRSELKLVALSLKDRPGLHASILLEASSATSTPRFSTLGVTLPDGETVPVLDRVPQVPPLSANEQAHLRSGRSLLRTSGALKPRVLMGLAIDPEHLTTGVLWGQIDPVYLWRAGDDDVALATDAELCVFDSLHVPLYCTFSRESSLLDRLKSELVSGDGGVFEWSDDHGSYMAGYWALFLEFNYVVPKWTVVLSESRASVLAPLASFRQTFPLVILLALMAVAFLSTGEIRKRLDPLAKLQEATQRIGMRDFDTAVSVTSGDEFEDLAMSFNRMTTRLQRQFGESERLNGALAQTGQQLRENEARLRTILESAADGIVTSDEQGVLQSFNRTAERMFGYTRDEVVGKRLTLLIHDGRDDHGAADLTRFQEGSHRVIGQRKDGTTFPMELAVREAPFGERRIFTGFLRDLSEREAAEVERQALERRLLQAQKLETIGTLAGRIAPDFNNILTPIHGYVDIVLADLPVGHKTAADLRQVKAAASRAQDLVRQILLFSRRDEPEQQVIPLQPAVKEALKLLRATLPSTIEIRQEIDNACAAVFADATQIHQMVMNLGTNAYHAMRESGGVLEVRLEMVSVDAELARVHSRLHEGSYVRLSVRDTGHGMDRDTLERLFEPFFTTKDVGEGTGLGLSVVHGIVMQHGGELTVSSEPGNGATFVIYLPAADREAPEEVVGGESDFKGDERVLMVDDEPQVASLGERTLERLGYQVTVMSDSTEALETFRAAPDSFDVVISDQTMPHMTGVQLGRELRRIRSDVPVVLVTGDTGQALAEQLEDLGRCEFVSKPFGLNDLGAAIRRLVDGKAEAMEEDEGRSQARPASAVTLPRESTGPVVIPFRVVVIEDDPDVRNLVQATLQFTAGWEVTTTADGAEGIEAVRRLRPDAVVVDLMMPGMDGYEVCRRLSEHPDTVGIPLVLFTGIRPDDAQVEAAGAAGVICKPFEPDKLACRIHQLCGASEG